MIARAGIVAAAILAAGAYTTFGAAGDAPVERRALAFLPRDLGGWSAPAELPLPADTVGLLGVDDYLSRRYARPGAAVSLYIGYYASQRQGDTIHSPQNCLPGAGWQPIEGGAVDVPIGGRTVRVNRYLVEKGTARQVVLYWYQGRGRVIANEFANKFWLTVDAARLGRTNGALVRVMAPVTGTTSEADAAALEFTRVLFPLLPSYLP